MSKTALVFPGQGAQSVGMGQSFYDASPACRALFDKASAMLDFNLAALCFQGPIEELTRSDHAQPAIFTISIAAWQALCEKRDDLAPAAFAGLSSGEYAALHAAGVLTFEDALRVLQARGRFMQEACEQQQGGMLSVIGLERDALEKICAASGAEMANLNSPQQTVLSGTVEAVAQAEILAKEAGAKRALRLKVAGAFHSTLMQPAADRLAAMLRDIPFRDPRTPVLSNVEGGCHVAGDAIREAMIRQVTSSVRWVDNVCAMRGMGIGRYIECGPGKVLVGLIKRIDKQASIFNIQSLSDVETVCEQL